MALFVRSNRPNMITAIRAAMVRNWIENRERRTARTRTAARGFAAVGTLSVLGALTAAAACNRENAHAAPPPPMAPLVTTASAVSRAVPTYLDEVGRNGAFESVTVTPQVLGRIVERHFQDGAQLTKGQLLFTVDPRPYQAQLDSAKAQLAETRAALDLAATQLKMYSSITDG